MRKIVSFWVYLPLVIYVWAAQHVAMFVPCTWDYRYDGKLVTTHGRTMWLLDITTQNIRWGLLAYTEILLLIVVAAIYGVILAFSESKRTSLRRRIDDWRQL